MIRFAVGLALCASGLLALSACGSGELSPAASSKPTGVSAKTYRIGPYTVVFATPLPADIAQAGVVEGFRQAQVVWDRSEYAWRMPANVRRYVTGHALVNLVDAVAASRKDHLIPAGTDRLFLTRVTRIRGGTATITTCDDASKFHEEDVHTGAESTQPPAQAYLFEIWQMVKHSGRWAIAAFSYALRPSPRAAPCQP